MKKFLAFFVAMLFVTAAAFADNYTGAHDNASASFDVKVIAPLLWSVVQPAHLEEVVAGETRDIDDVTVTFYLTGQSSYNVTVATHGPDMSGSVQLLGSWSTIPTALTSSGTANVSYTVDKIKSGNTADHGEYSFTISVDAFYTNL